MSDSIEITLTDRDIESYISIQGVRCPYPDCGSDDLYVGLCKSESDGKIRQSVQCTHCNRTWYDIYTLSGVEEERE